MDLGRISYGQLGFCCTQVGPTNKWLPSAANIGNEDGVAANDQQGPIAMSVSRPEWPLSDFFFVVIALRCY